VRKFSYVDQDLMWNHLSLEISTDPATKSVHDLGRFISMSANDDY
jgi:hypothetical protein